MSYVTNPFRSAGRGVLAVAVGLALVVPAQASANGDSVWKECIVNGTVSTNHSQADFESAIANPPADASEYSDCLDQITNAQVKAARGGSSSGSSGGSSSGAAGAAGGSGGSSSGGGTSSGGGSPVAPAALSKALQASGVNPAAPAGAAAPAPAPTVIDGKSVDVGSSRAPSIASAFSLPLPLAASAVVVLFSAALPVIRYAVGRFGSPPVGTNQLP